MSAAGLPARLRAGWRVLRTALGRWARPETSQHAAAISFDAALAIAPLALLLLAALARVVGPPEAREGILETVEGIAGESARPLVDSVLVAVSRAPGVRLATALGVTLVLLFASSVFWRIKIALNAVWGIDRPPGLRGALGSRLFSFGMMLMFVGSVLLVAALNFFASVFFNLLAARFPAAGGAWSWLHIPVSLAVLALLLTFVFRRGPDVELALGDVTGGAVLTALLIGAGNHLAGRFIGRTLLPTLYGAAGTLVIFLLWIYWDVMILLLGAHVTRAWAEQCGSRKPATPREAGA